MVAGAVTAALAATEPVRTEAATRGSAALAALKGEVEAPKPKKHRIRKLFVLATVLGAAYAGWKAWASQQQSSDPVSPWTSDSPTTSMSTVSPVRRRPTTPAVPARTRRWPTRSTRRRRRGRLRRRRPSR